MTIEMIKNSELFFLHSLKDSLQKNNLEITDYAISYLMQLLNDLTNPKMVVQYSEEIACVDKIKVIVTKCGHEKAYLLRELGDYTLIWSGLFREQLKHKKINLSYYQEIGETSYIQSGNIHLKLGSKGISDVCYEIGNNFIDISDALTDCLSI